MRISLFLTGSALGLIFLVAGPLRAFATPHVVASGFSMERIATVEGARELAIAPNGDLYIGTNGRDVFVVHNAEDRAQAPRVFVSIDDAPAAGVAIAGNDLIVGAQFGVYRMPLHSPGARPQKLVSVRTSGGSSDHLTTSVTVSNGHIYASVGSSCNVCNPELDRTRATVNEIVDGHLRQVAVHIRNAIALAVNPSTGSVWAGVAGQDELEHGHPFEIFDPISAHGAPADYGWPYCYENRRALEGHDCSRQVIARVVFPAYETPIGAVFYPVKPSGRHAFPKQYWAGAFVTLHGSWHMPLVPPRVVFVAMHGDNPSRGVNWNDPNAQWSEFVGGYQDAGGRSGRPTGITVGPQGDIFVADDLTGAIYRIRAK